MITHVKSLALSVPVIVAGACAQAAVIDFSGFAEGTVMNGAFDFGNGLTGTLSSSDLSSSATGDIIICDTSTAGSDCRENDPDLQSNFLPGSSTDFDLGAIDFGNALILEETGGSGSGANVDDAANGGMITFVFDNMVRLSTLSILDGADNSPTGASIFFDASAVAFATGRGGDDNEYDIVDLGDTVVSSFSIHFAGSGALGGFEATVVPLPAGGVLALSAFGLLGALRFRQRRGAASKAKTSVS
ncbi:MAG: VPLPA-CTERM sorting domain-containing protein [Pseudomonadota bacterium]